MAREASIVQDPQQSIEKVVGDIVVAFLQTQTISAQDLPGLVFRVRSALVGMPHVAELAKGEAVAPLEAVASNETESGPRLLVPLSESVHPDYLVSLEDGKRYKALRRHLKSKFNLSPEEYRAKWGLPADYPMVAPNYAKRRSELARSYDFGRAHRAATDAVKAMPQRPSRKR